MPHFLTPVLALILWSLIIWAVMMARRIPAMNKAGITPDSARAPDGAWKSKMPEYAEYAAHNYNHLMEQPTVFYALMFYIFMTDGQSSLMLYGAWAYVILRVLHSLVQITVNKVMVRFSIFTLSTLILIIMACAQAARLF